MKRIKKWKIRKAKNGWAWPTINPTQNKTMEKYIQRVGSMPILITP
jgi:hypothetical protein